MDWAAKSNQLVTCAAVSTPIVTVLYVQSISGALEHSVFAYAGNIWLVRPVDCNVKTPRFPKHEFSILATRNVQT